MDYREIPLLITSAIRPIAKYTALQNAELRLNATIEGLNEWLRRDIKNVVICDGSGVDLKPLVKSKLSKHKSTIEFLSFVNNEVEVQIHGKGYGEGEIINFAIENSESLKVSQYFMKCTSKLWVENCEQIAKRFNRVFMADFNGRFSFKSLDTRFYITSQEFYLKHLKECYTQVNDDSKYFLEHAFLDSIIDSGLNNWIALPSVRIRGLSGTDAQYHQLSKTKYLLRDLRNFVRSLV